MLYVDVSRTDTMLLVNVSRADTIIFIDVLRVDIMIFVVVEQLIKFYLGSCVDTLLVLLLEIHGYSCR